MPWFNNPIIWITIICIIIIIIIMVYKLASKPRVKPIEQTYQPRIAGQLDEPLDNDETKIDDDHELYEESLPNWTSTFMRNDGLDNSSVKRYTRHEKQQIHNVSSLNAAITPSFSESIPFNEEIRFQTPTKHSPNINPDFSNYIRKTDVTLNVGGIETNKGSPFPEDTQEYTDLSKN